MKAQPVQLPCGNNNRRYTLCTNSIFKSTEIKKEGKLWSGKIYKASKWLVLPTT